MHRFTAFDLSAPAVPAVSSAEGDAIARWTVECLGLDETAVVKVYESACLDPGCPIVETVVAVFEEGGTRAWRFARPRAAVTKAMVLFAIQGGDGRTPTGRAPKGMPQ